MMRRKFAPALRKKRGIDMNTVVFQHLNSSGSTSQGTDSFRVEPITPDHTISQISTILTILCGGYLKDRVYENNPQTREVLQDNIRREIR